MHHIKIFFSTYLFLPIVFLMGIALTSCSQYQPQQSTAVFTTDLTQNSAQYLTQAQQTTGTTQIDWLLLAANASLKEKKNAQAESILQHLVSQPLDKIQQQELYLTQAMLAYFEQDAKSAQQFVDKLNPQRLTGVQLYHYSMIQVYLSSGDPLQQLAAYIQLEKAAQTVTEQHQIIDETWQMLSQITAEQMSKFVINADNITLQGWLDLWQVRNNNQSDFDKLQTAIAAWQARYPYNPAATYLPRTIFSPYYTLPTDNSTLKVALLLPLSGEYQSVGQAILLGFEQAMSTSNLPAQNREEKVNQVSNNSSNLPSTDSKNSVTTVTKSKNTQVTQATSLNHLWLKQEIAQHLKVYDTNSTTNMSDLISKAEQSGAQLIVGPWLSKNVSAVENLSSNVPILALNSPNVSELSSGSNLCYFSTSPTEEAREAAQYIYHQGKKEPLVLAPDNTLGHAIANAFAQGWHSAGGTNVVGQFFPNKTELTKLMNQGVGITLEGAPLLPTTSQNSTSSLKADGVASNSSVSQRVVTQATTSNDVDAIYIVASKDQSLLLKPMLEMLSPKERVEPEMALKKLPQIYMSSFTRQQDEGTDFNLEMNNIIFSDIPLLGKNQQSKLNLLPSYIKDDYTLTRAYALGEDAWSLAANYTEMRNDPSYQLQGETGSLSVGANCVIQRKPVWQKYSDGHIVVLP